MLADDITSEMFDKVKEVLKPYVDEFIKYADNVEFSEEQRRVQYEDFRRDMARDDALLDGWEGNN